MQNKLFYVFKFSSIHVHGIHNLVFLGFLSKDPWSELKYKRLDLRLLEGIQSLELTHNSSGLSRSWDSLVNPIWRRPQSPISQK